MELYIDDADAREIERLIDLYPIDGVTTNPSILAKTGRDPKEVLGEIRQLSQGPPRSNRYRLETRPGSEVPAFRPLETIFEVA